MIVWAGIDPGLSGGAAVLIGDDVVESCLLPTDLGPRGNTEIDADQLLRWFVARNVRHCVVEAAQAMPDQGRSTGFNYGASYGAVVAVLRVAGIRHHPVAPSAWKRSYGLLRAKGSKEPIPKSRSLELARELWPGARDQFARIKDNHRAEAALMARWGKREIDT